MNLNFSAPAFCGLGGSDPPAIACAALTASQPQPSSTEPSRRGRRAGQAPPARRSVARRTLGYMSGTTARRRVLRVSVSGAAAEHRADLLAVEEPLEIRVNGEPLTVTMRTPGDDIDLAAGFLFTEGLLPRLDEVREIRMCDQNVAAVTLEPGRQLA